MRRGHLCTGKHLQFQHVNPPFPFEGRFWHVCHRDHLFSRSDPHDGAVVALSGALQPQTGESSPRQSPLHKHRVRNFLYNKSQPHQCFCHIYFAVVKLFPRGKTVFMGKNDTDIHMSTG